ncbi:MAG: chorismate mutase [Myxococcota bacterium]
MALPPEILSLRRDIDRLDQELVELLARRRDVVRRMREVKQAHALPLRDPEREAAMRRSLVEHGQALGVPGSLVEAVLDAILEDSRGKVG